MKLESDEEIGDAYADLERLCLALSAVLDAVDKKRHPIGPPDPIEAIKFRLDQQGLTRKALEPILGSRARVSEVLSGKRRLTLTMIRKLHAELGIPLESLIGEVRR